MSLTAKTVIQYLAPCPVRFFEQVESTNDLALAWLREGAVSGSIVVADEQVRGRGRMGRAWYTPPGTALIVSVILHPSAVHVGRITMLGALAICGLLDGLREMTARESAWTVGIKWPNDVQLNERKVCGVLSEAVWDGDKLRGVVLGMGINVRIDFIGTDLAESAISIEPTLGRPVERLTLLADLLSNIDYWYGRLGDEILFHTWKSRLNTIGQDVTVEQGTINGLAEDVDASGALLVRDANGVLQRVVAGDIALGSTS